MVNGNFRRGDHRELLELVVVYLGGVVLRPRKNKDPKAVETYVLNRPIATNQTRFMGIALHELKIALLGPQFEQDAVGQEQTTALAEVLCLLYAPYFLQARLASAAPRLDRDLYVRLVQYRRLHDEGSLHYAMAEAMRFSLLRHTWFLTQELVPFYLWDENVPTRERKAVADVLLRVNPPAVWETGKPNLPNILPDKPRLQDMVGPRSHLLFHNLRVGTHWLRRPVRHWVDDQEFQRIKAFLKDLQVVNDIAEPCIQDVTNYANTTKDSVHRDEILLVVSDQRFVFNDLTRNGLDNARLT